jgi:pimeloyl-ACP methyl ester carboxylesterase
MVSPYLVREVAEAIAVARYKEIEGCGHSGYLERSTEVNKMILKLFAFMQPVSFRSKEGMLSGAA